jgi:D-threo-aldose 1-dehydrogenase
MSKIKQRVKFGKQDWDSTIISFGSVPIGNFGRVVTTSDSHQLITDAWDQGIRFFDTAPMYGHGLAEYRLADILIDKNREEYQLITKVGRTLVPAHPSTFDSSPWVNTPAFRLEFDYSYEGVMRQVEDSLQRLGTHYLDVLLIHDTDRWTHGDAYPQRFNEAIEGAAKALTKLRDEKIVKSIGFGVNEVEVCLKALDIVDVDAFLIAGTYTLLNQSASRELLPRCEELGVGVINGRVFGSGILATGSTLGAKFDYAVASNELVMRVKELEKICDEFGISLGAAAIQFAATGPAIANVCIGSRTIEQQNQSFDWFNEEIPNDFWDKLREKELIEIN